MIYRNIVKNIHLICSRRNGQLNECVTHEIKLHQKYSDHKSVTTFIGNKDRFNGLTVDTSKEKCEENNFPKLLEDSLNKWKKYGNRCIWFKVNIKDASLVPVLAQKGFNFHHARDDFVVMYKWLPEDCRPNLPPASHVNLGVGAMVFNNAGQLLAISEKNYGYPHWKLPGGYVEKGEEIIDAAVREVKEETGVDTEFQSLVTFRHTHNMMYGNSDIYILIRLKAITEHITISQREIEACQWMNVEEYINHPHVHEFNKLIVKKALEYKDNNIKLDLKKRSVKWATFIREMNYLTIDKIK